MNVLKALAGAIMVIVGIVWGVLGLLYLAQGVYGAATTRQAASAAAIFGGLTLFGMGAGSWLGRFPPDGRRFRMTTARAAALDAFYLEHRRSGELDTGVDDDRVWMTCTCGARINLRTESEVWRIGVIIGAPVTDGMGPNPQSPAVAALLRGLRDLGYVYGRDFVTEVRSTGTETERSRAIAAELAKLKVDVIVAARQCAHRDRDHHSRPGGSASG